MIDAHPGRIREYRVSDIEKNGKFSGQLLRVLSNGSVRLASLRASEINIIVTPQERHGVLHHRKPDCVWLLVSAKTMTN